MDIGGAIRKIRQIKNMSQNILAKQAGISVSHLSLIENNDREPSLSAFLNIADALSLPGHELLLVATYEETYPNWTCLGKEQDCEDVYVFTTKSLYIFVGKGHHLYPKQWAFRCPKIGITSFKPLGCSIKGDAFNEALTFCKEHLAQMFKELEDY